MLITSTVKCPYCSKAQPATVDTDKLNHTDTMYCDSEIGGCDKLFFYEAIRRYEVNAFPIDGYNK